MPKTSKKTIASELDYNIMRLTQLEGLRREDVAKLYGITIATVDYHIAEAKRILGVDTLIAKDTAQKLMVPIAYAGLQLIAKAFNTQDAKHLDAAIKFLRNAGYTIEQSEVTVTNKDNRDASADFEAVMQKVKSRAVDAEIVNVGSTSPVSESEGQESTSTSTSESLGSILPLDKSRIENPKLEE